MYRVSECPEDEVRLQSGAIVHPLVTFTTDSGHPAAHIIQDSGCYVLLLDRDDYCILTPWWFPEAVAAVRMLPMPTKDNTFYDYVERDHE